MSAVCPVSGDENDGDSLGTTDKHVHGQPRYTEGRKLTASPPLESTQFSHSVLHFVTELYVDNNE